MVWRETARRRVGEVSEGGFSPCHAQVPLCLAMLGEHLGRFPRAALVSPPPSCSISEPYARKGPELSQTRVQRDDIALESSTPPQCKARRGFLPLDPSLYAPRKVTKVAAGDGAGQG